MQMRRTSAQVQQDKELAARAKTAAKAKKTTIAEQNKERVAAFEDQLHREDQQREKNMACWWASSALSASKQTTRNAQLLRKGFTSGKDRDHEENQHSC